MILVDSSVWIDFFNGRATPRVANLALLLDDMAPVAVADLVLFEVLRGFRHERDYLAARKTLTALTVVEIGGEDNALQAAQHDRLLRAMGTPSAARWTCSRPLTASNTTTPCCTTTPTSTSWKICAA